MSEGLMYSCRPLSAWISESQCQHNAALAERAAKARPGSNLRDTARWYIDRCPGCPGVVEVSKRNGVEPRTFDSGIMPVRASHRVPVRLRIKPSAEQTRRANLRRHKQAMRSRTQEKEQREAANPDPETITIKEITQHIGRSDTTVRDGLADAGIHPIQRARAGRRSYFRRADVEPWMQLWRARIKAQAKEGEKKSEPPICRAQPECGEAYALEAISGVRTRLEQDIAEAEQAIAEATARKEAAEDLVNGLREKVEALRGAEQAIREVAQ